jgi:hypothetical protein
VTAAQVFLAPRLGGIEVSTNGARLCRRDARSENIGHRQVEGMGETAGHLRNALPVGQRCARADLIRLQSQLEEEGSRIRNVN